MNKYNANTIKSSLDNIQAEVTHIRNTLIRLDINSEERLNFNKRLISLLEELDSFNHDLEYSQSRD
jgi:hypothetical protein